MTSTAVQSSLAIIKANLWPKASYTPSFVAGAVNKAFKAYGQDESNNVIDVGYLMAGPTSVLIRMPDGWKQYDDTNPRHLTAANTFNRVGTGWSFSSNNAHNSARGWYRELFGKEPTEKENVDLNFNRTLYNTLHRIVVLGTGEPEPSMDFDITSSGKDNPGSGSGAGSGGSGQGSVTPPVKPPVTPPVKPPSIGTLSHPLTRADELRSMIVNSEVRVVLQHWTLGSLLLHDACWQITRVFVAEGILVWRLIKGKLV